MLALQLALDPLQRHLARGAGGPQAVDIVRRELHLHIYIAGACPARLGVVAPEGNCSLDTDAPQWVKASGCISVGLY